MRSAVPRRLVAEARSGEGNDPPDKNGCDFNPSRMGFGPGARRRRSPLDSAVAAGARRH